MPCLNAIQIQSHLRLTFFPFATKISGEVTNLGLIFPLLFQNKKVTTHKNCGLIFCFAKPPIGKCSAKSRAKILRLLTLRLKVARLRLNFGILSQNCDWYFSLISSPDNFVSFLVKDVSRKMARSECETCC